MNLTKIIAHLAIIATTMGTLTEAGFYTQKDQQASLSSDDSYTTATTSGKVITATATSSPTVPPASTNATPTTLVTSTPTSPSKSWSGVSGGLCYWRRVPRSGFESKFLPYDDSLPEVSSSSKSSTSVTQSSTYLRQWKSWSSDSAPWTSMLDGLREMEKIAKIPPLNCNPRL